MNQQVALTKGERTRAHIVATAGALFWRRSFHGVAMDEVAQAAEVNKATIYRYFADKSDLALAVARFNGEVSLEVVFLENFRQHRAPQDRIAAVFRQIYCAHRRMFESEGDIYGCPIVGLTLELGQELPALRAEAQRIFLMVENLMVEVAQDALLQRGVDGDPATLGRTLTQLLHGAFASARVSADPDLILDAGRAALALIGFPDTPILDKEAAE
jgi:AcrR family transcriptional regulator